MDAKYRSEIENSCLKRRLLIVDNVPAIEDILDKESQRLGRLQNLKEDGRLDFGDTVSSDELRELFPQICKEVDTFLGIQESGVPNCRYYHLFRPGLMTTPILVLYTLSALQVTSALTSFSTDQNPDTNHLLGHLFSAGAGATLFYTAAAFHAIVKKPRYDTLSQKINLERVARTELIPAAGHEYTHHIQWRNGIRSNRKHDIFMEGHAQGVEKQLADNYREREDNEAFLYVTSSRTVNEFKSAYLWMCKKLGLKPRESLLETKTSRDRAERRRSIHREPSSHALGNALFSIYEALKGRGIYKQMIHGEFQFA